MKYMAGLICAVTGVLALAGFGAQRIQTTIELTTAPAIIQPTATPSPTAQGLTIGLANHNPGNIRSMHHWQRWAGAVGVDAPPWRYLIFATDYDGMVALRKVLKAYHHKHHLRALPAIVNRWVGPPRSKRDAENKRGYLKAIAQRTRLKVTDNVDLEDSESMANLARAIVWAENGSDPYPDALYRKVFKN